jgi:N utilization substance protein A
VDIIPFDQDIAEFVKASLAPAEGLSVKLNEKTKTATVKAPEDQLSLAIGRDGQNARLSAKLTGWKVEVEEAKVVKSKKVEKEQEIKEEKIAVKKTKKVTKKVSKKVEKKEKEDVGNVGSDQQDEKNGENEKNDNVTNTDGEAEMKSVEN